MFSSRLFSSRLSWDLRPNRLSELLEAKRLSGTAILDLTESNPTRAGLAYPAEEIAQSLASPASLLYEPAPAGLPGRARPWQRITLRAAERSSRTASC